MGGEGSNIFLHSKNAYDLLQVFSKLLNQAMKGRELAMTVDIANHLEKMSVLPKNGRRRQKSAPYNIFYRAL